MDNEFSKEINQKGGNGILVLVLGVVILILSGLLGLFILNDNFRNTVIKKNDVKDSAIKTDGLVNVNSKEKKILDINSLLVKNLYYKVSRESDGTSCNNTYNLLWKNGKVDFDADAATNEQIGKFIALNLAEQHFTYHSCKSGKIDKQYGYFYTECYKNDNFSNATISTKYVDTIYENIFGKGKKLDRNVPIYVRDIAYIYNANLDSYILVYYEGGGTCGPDRIIGTIKEAYTLENKLVITDEVKVTTDGYERSKFLVDFTFVHDGEGYRFKSAKQR